MKITFLGTGTSQGVPVIACDCDVCDSIDPRDHRLRSSVMIEVNGLNLVIDTGPDFRQQMLRENVQNVDAVIFTHEHKDHVAGLDDIRAFNFKHKKEMPIYATEIVQQTLKREFHYVFNGTDYPGIPQLQLHTITTEPFKIKNTEIIPIEVLHYTLPVLGYRIGDFTYITDANFISKESKEKIKGSKVLVLNALRREDHISHFTLDEAIALANELEVELCYLTHISHLMGMHHIASDDLPLNVKFAYDGLKVRL